MERRLLNRRFAFSAGTEESLTTLLRKEARDVSRRTRLTQTRLQRRNDRAERLRQFSFRASDLSGESHQIKYGERILHDITE